MDQDVCESKPEVGSLREGSQIQQSATISSSLSSLLKEQQEFGFGSKLNTDCVQEVS